MGIDQFRRAERGNTCGNDVGPRTVHPENKETDVYSPPPFCPSSLLSFLLLHVPRSTHLLSSDLGLIGANKRRWQTRAVLLNLTLVPPPNGKSQFYQNPLSTFNQRCIPLNSFCAAHIPPSFSPPLGMHPRGRSTDVSPVALARLASEERRRSRTSESIMSSYPLPSDPEKRAVRQFYLSLPSPLSSPTTSSLPLTPPDPTPLCAHSRARIVHPDTLYAPIDPHESHFPDQIFHPQLLPHPAQSPSSSSLLTSPLAEKAAFKDEAGHCAWEQARAKCRYEALARAEQVFSTILERSRRERLAALLLRARQEDEAKERERVTRELERLEHERDRRRPISHISHVPRSGFRVLSRVPPPVPTSQQRQVPDRFTYTFPLPSTSPTSPGSMRQPGGVKARLGLPALTSPNATNTRSVSFDDVTASMGDVLFPIAHGESVSGKTRRESELLGTLLDPVRWEDGERWHPRGRVNAWAPRVPETGIECEACGSESLSLGGFSAPFPPTPSSSSGVSASTSTSIASRPISWLSFSSRKSTSSVTMTHPSPPSTNNYSQCASGHPTPQRSCGSTRGQGFVTIDVNDSPLSPSADSFPALALSVASVNRHQESALPRPRKTSLSARTWLAMQSVVSVLSAAARFQDAYVSTTAATFLATDYTHDAPMLIRSPSETVPGYARRLPSGSRASQSDVVKFTSTASQVDRETVPYILYDLVELKSTRRFPASIPELPCHDSIPPHSPTTSIVIPPTYQDADRHIFNANPVHLLSRAQINSWRCRGAPGAMPSQVFCRPELYYRIEPAGGSPREANSGSALKWGWRVVWDNDDHGQC